MAAFLGALEYVLEEGPSKDWFEASAMTVRDRSSRRVGAVVFFWRVTHARNPIVDLAAFHDRNFWTGSLSFVLGIGLYGLTYIYPVYLAGVRGYSPLMIGETMFVTGVCQFITAPMSGS